MPSSSPIIKAAHLISKGSTGKIDPDNTPVSSFRVQNSTTRLAWSPDLYLQERERPPLFPAWSAMVFSLIYPFMPADWPAPASPAAERHESGSAYFLFAHCAARFEYGLHSSSATPQTARLPRGQPGNNHFLPSSHARHIFCYREKATVEIAYG